MRPDLHMIINADPADPPFAELVGLEGQGLQRRTVDLLQQLTARDAQPPDRALFVEMGHQLGDRRVHLRQTVEEAPPKPPQQPAFDDKHGLLDFGLVARASGTRGQDRGVIMSRHLPIGSVDLRVIKAGLYHRCLRVVGHEQLRGAADGRKALDMSVNPVWESLGPAGVREGEARDAKHRHKDLRLPDLAGQPVHDDRHAIARIIDEQPLASRMGLAHRDWQARLPVPI